jgi:predicted nucleic acid-binding protein
LILDTNALSAFADGAAAVGGVLRRQRRVALPVIVLGEYRYGIARARHRRADADWLDAHLPDFEVLAVDDETARSYADVRVALRHAGKPIPANDAWIASLALQHGLPVLSRDEHFDVIPGLRRVAW